MKYLNQFGVIAAVCFVSELLYVLLGLPIPASVYGLVLMLILLLTKVVKLSQIEEAGGMLLAIMPIFFLAPAVGLMESVSSLEGQLVGVIVVLVVTTLITMITTAAISQCIIRMRNKRSENNE